MGQYFDNDPALPHQSIIQRFALLGEEYSLESDRGVFSKEGLDDGTKLLLETIAKTHLGREILDLGCGIGTIGLILAHIDPSRRLTLADVNTRALELAGRNAERLGVKERVEILESDVYTNINKTYDTIVTNPPIRAGKKVTYAMYAGAVSHLNEDGRLILVIRKKQGADSAEEYLRTLYASVEKVASKKGYRVLIARK